MGILGLIQIHCSISSKWRVPNIRTLFACLLLVVASLSCATATFAQVTGAITGQVIDSSGAVVSGVVVIATNVSTNVAQKATTSAEGEYRLLALQPGLPSGTPGRTQRDTDSLLCRARNHHNGSWREQVHQDCRRCVVPLRVEFFNIFNHTNFNNPVGNISNASQFGQVISARDPRIGQIAAKFVF